MRIADNLMSSLQYFKFSHSPDAGTPDSLLLPSPQPEDDQEETEAKYGSSTAQTEGRGESECELGLGHNPVGGTIESLTGPEEGHEAGLVDLVEDGEGWVGAEDGGELEVDLDGERDAKLGVEVDVNVVFVIVWARSVGQQGVRGGVEAVGEGDCERRSDVRVAGLETEVPAGQTLARAGVRTVAGVLLQSVVLSLIPRHRDVLDGELLHLHHLHRPAHDGQHHGEPLLQPGRETAGLRAARDLVTAGVLLPSPERGFAVNIKDLSFRSEVRLAGLDPAMIPRHDPQVATSLAAHLTVSCSVLFRSFRTPHRQSPESLRLLDKNSSSSSSSQLSHSSSVSPSVASSLFAP